MNSVLYSSGGFESHLMYMDWQIWWWLPAVPALVVAAVALMRNSSPTRRKTGTVWASTSLAIVLLSFVGFAGGWLIVAAMNGIQAGFLPDDATNVPDGIHWAFGIVGATVVAIASLSVLLVVMSARTHDTVADYAESWFKFILAGSAAVAGIFVNAYAGEAEIDFAVGDLFIAVLAFAAAAAAGLFLASAAIARGRVK